MSDDLEETMTFLDSCESVAAIVGSLVIGFPVAAVLFGAAAWIWEAVKS